MRGGRRRDPVHGDRETESRMCGGGFISLKGQNLKAEALLESWMNGWTEGGGKGFLISQENLT